MENRKTLNQRKYIAMDSLIKNTQFDNLVNYETGILSNSSRQTVAHQSSADPNALSSLLRESPLVEISFAITTEKYTVNTCL
jgi:hypothetical protein